MRIAREKIFAIIVFSMSTLLMLGVCEITLRILLFSDSLSIPSIRQAWRFSDGNYEDDFWKLVYIFGDSRGATRAGSFDARLGWAPPSGPGNPLGIISERPYKPEDVVSQPILFYGDSFVAGTTAMEHRIPQVLDRLIPDRTVLNYGVSGYGVDQIFLRYSLTVDNYDKPLVMVGILMRDLDRSILSLRSGQKPYFELLNNQLVLRNSPITSSIEAFIEKNPPAISSYLGRFIVFRLKHLMPESWFDSLLGYDDVQRDKLAINRAILEQFAAGASKLGTPFYFVLFYNGEELHAETWRESFLKSTLGQLGMTYFDTKPLLLKHMRKTGLDLYDADDGHLNRYGNELVAEHLADWLSDHDAVELPRDDIQQSPADGVR